MNTAEKINTVESIFDHDITDNEISAIFFGLDRSEIVSPEPYSNDFYKILYKIYSYRKNKKIAQDYLNKIDDELVRFNTSLNDRL